MWCKVARALAAMVLMIAAAACGAASLDTSGLEDELAQQIETQLEVSVTVECPEDVDVEEGSTFECTASDGQGNAFAIEVTQANDEGDVTWKLIEASQ
jgi:hypothetical protein